MARVECCIYRWTCIDKIVAVLKVPDSLGAWHYRTRMSHEAHEAWGVVSANRGELVCCEVGVAGVEYQPAVMFQEDILGREGRQLALDEMKHS